MRVRCPACDRPGPEISEHLITPGGTRCRCASCNAMFLIFPDGFAVGAPAAEAGDSGQTGSGQDLRSETVSPVDPGYTAGPAEALSPTEVARPTPKDPTAAGMLSSGDTLADQFEIREFLGRGGFGEVYRAEDRILRESTAIKVIPARGDTDALHRMVADEYRAQRGIRDREHILTVSEPRICQRGEASLLLLPMELAKQSLREWLDERRDGVGGRQGEGLELFCQACRGVAAIHDAGLVHLDIKPENVLLLEHIHDSEAATREGDGGEEPRGTRWRVKVGDFGLARAIGGSRDVRAGLAADGIGTPAYMAPEQIRAARWKDVGPAADIYGLGMILYEILDGELPYSGNAREIIEKKKDLAVEIQPPPGPERLVRLAMACLSRRPSERPESALELVECLGKELDEATVAAVETEDVEAREPEMGKGERAGEERTIEIFPGVQMGFVWIPPGSFPMGAPKDQWKLHTGSSSVEPEEYEKESPVHEVEITRGFWLGKYQVTRAQWQGVFDSDPDFEKDTRCPVDDVSWEACQAFAEELNNAIGQEVYRLPTEAEWEYACRAGSRAAYCFGDDESDLRNYAWYDDTAGGDAQPVGQKRPNAWGLYDMHGNVNEWCQDWFGANYYARSPRQDPLGPKSGTYRVVRGSDAWLPQRECRCASRSCWSPDGEDNPCNGFRLVRTTQ
ncbi:MAG: SUMF1/EgtB/PvdO family nonheme iron enzyme [Candidatus Eisenbacteria sp.]|nr:SUMF1/EgtB/PvdO family nonheme iron enzyme [Candidatus Eisenbacteria bacterium]